MTSASFLLRRGEVGGIRWIARTLLVDLDSLPFLPQRMVTWVLDGRKIQKSNRSRGGRFDCGRNSGIHCQFDSSEEE